MRWKTNWRGEGELKRKKVESERGDAGDDDKATTSSPDWDWSTWCFHERYGVTSTCEAKQNNHCHGIGMFLRWTPQQLFSPWENTSRRRFSFRFWLWIIHEEGEKKKRDKNREIIKSKIKIDYQQFRKNFYTQAREITRMSPAYRKQLDLKIREKCAPKPIKTRHQTGLTTKILETCSKLNHENPVPIQAPASALIISGLDSVAIAETGSGKTLAFLLPMLRHI